LRYLATDVRHHAEHRPQRRAPQPREQAAVHTLALPPDQHAPPRNKRLTTDPRGMSTSRSLGDGYLYQAIDQFGQVIDVLAAEKRDVAATGQFFTRALAPGTRPAEVTTDRVPAYLWVLDELLPAACHVVDQYSNNPIEADHGRLKSRLRSMHGRKRLQSARVINTGRALRAKPPLRP
jgi:hypothetical protein